MRRGMLHRLGSLRPLWLLALWTAFAPGAAARELRFGITPVLGSAAMHQDFDPLAQYLTQALGRVVVLEVTPDYGALRTRMDQGEVDIGSFSPFAYVEAAADGRVRIIAQSLIDGVAWYRGIIVVRRDSGLDGVGDLRGKRFAYVDPQSASGYVYPRALLIDRGVNPAHFFARTFFAGDHSRVIAAVLQGRADGGATYDNALRIAEAAGLPAHELKVILETDPIPHDAIAVRAGLDPGLTQRLLAALLAVNHTPEGRRVIALNKKGLTGFAAADDATFDVVRRVAREAGVIGR